jgi:hypothetical protein
MTESQLSLLLGLGTLFITTALHPTPLGILAWTLIAYACGENQL